MGLNHTPKKMEDERISRMIAVVAAAAAAAVVVVVVVSSSTNKVYVI
jgi:hypothetical protein